MTMSDEVEITVKNTKAGWKVEDRSTPEFWMKIPKAIMVDEVLKMRKTEIQLLEDIRKLSDATRKLVIQNRHLKKLVKNYSEFVEAVTE